MRHTADLFVAEDGLIYVTDYDAGLYILQWNGRGRDRPRAPENLRRKQ